MEGKRFICQDCGKWCWGEDLVHKDNGGYEEYWGAKVWMPYIVLTCPSCGSEEIEEIADDGEEKEEEK